MPLLPFLQLQFRAKAPPTRPAADAQKLLRPRKAAEIRETAEAKEMSE
jgi:hypothetical protein